MWVLEILVISAAYAYNYTHCHISFASQPLQISFQSNTKKRGEKFSRNFK